MDWNDIYDPTSLSVGDQLFVGAPAHQARGASNRPCLGKHRHSKSCTVPEGKHRARPGDTVASIAETYLLSVADLVLWNPELAQGTGGEGSEGDEGDGASKAGQCGGVCADGCVRVCPIVSHLGDSKAEKSDALSKNNLVAGQELWVRPPPRDAAGRASGGAKGAPGIAAKAPVGATVPRIHVVAAPDSAQDARRTSFLSLASTYGVGVGEMMEWNDFSGGDAHTLLLPGMRVMVEEPPVAEHFKDEFGEDKPRALQLLRAVTSALESAGVDYMMYAGSVISHCRHNASLNPFDTDIDLLINAREYTAAITAISSWGVVGGGRTAGGTSSGGAHGDTHTQGQDPLGVASDRDADPSALGRVIKAFFKSSPRAGAYAWRYPFIDIWLYDIEWGKGELEQEDGRGARERGGGGGVGGGGGDMADGVVASKEGAPHEGQRFTESGQACARTFLFEARLYVDACASGPSFGQEWCYLANSKVEASGRKWNVCKKLDVSPPPRSRKDGGWATHTAPWMMGTTPGAPFKPGLNGALWPGARILVTQSKATAGWRIPAPMMLPTKLVQFEGGMQLRIPNEAGAFLDWEYGESWRTECRMGSYDHRNEIQKAHSKAHALACADIEAYKHAQGEGRDWPFTIGDQAHMMCPLPPLPRTSAAPTAQRSKFTHTSTRTPTHTAGTQQQQQQQQQLSLCAKNTDRRMSRNNKLLLMFDKMAKRLGIDYWLTQQSALGQEVWGGNIPYADHTRVDVALPLRQTSLLEAAALEAPKQLAKVYGVRVTVHPEWNTPWNRRVSHPSDSKGPYARHGAGKRDPQQQHLGASVARVYLVDAAADGNDTSLDEFVEVWGAPVGTDIVNTGWSHALGGAPAPGEIAEVWENRQRYTYMSRPIDWVLPTRDCQFDGMAVRCMAEQPLLLQLWYGQNYRVPRQRCDAKTGQWVKNELEQNRGTSREPSMYELQPKRTWDEPRQPTYKRQPKQSANDALVARATDVAKAVWGVAADKAFASTGLAARRTAAGCSCARSWQYITGKYGASDCITVDSPSPDKSWCRLESPSSCGGKAGPDWDWCTHDADNTRTAWWERGLQQQHGQQPAVARASVAVTIGGAATAVGASLYAAFIDELARHAKYRTKWKALLGRVAKLLGAADIDYFIFGGTVLSYCRHKGSLSPFDTTVQMLISSQDVARGVKALQEDDELVVFTDRGGPTVLGNVHKIFFKGDPKAGKYGWSYPFVDLTTYQMRFDATGFGEDDPADIVRAATNTKMGEEAGGGEGLLLKKKGHTAQDPAGALPKEMPRNGRSWAGAQVFVQTRSDERGLRYPAELFFPTADMWLDGVKVRGPKEPGMFLDFKYGTSSQWRTTCEVGKYDRERERAKQTAFNPVTGPLQTVPCAELETYLQHLTTDRIQKLAPDRVHKTSSQPGQHQLFAERSFAWPVARSEEDVNRRCPVLVLPPSNTPPLVRVCADGDQGRVDNCMHLLKMWKALAGHLDLVYWLSYGSALGQEVWGGQIPYDTDIDVEIIQGDTIKLQNVASDEALLSKLGIHKLRIHPHWRRPWTERQYLPNAGLDFKTPVGRLYDKAGRYVDIWGAPTHDDLPGIVPKGHIATQFERYEYIPRPMSFVFPTRPCVFGGVEVQCAAEQALYCRHTYGVNWKTPYRTCDAATKTWVKDARFGAVLSKWW